MEVAGADAAGDLVLPLQEDLAQGRQDAGTRVHPRMDPHIAHGQGRPHVY